jgi:hypothetical protein
MLFVVSVPKVFGWGFYAHKQLNYLAVFTLPPELFGFYKQNIAYLSENAINPDKRRYIVVDEAPRHYIDIDHYGTYPFDNVPHRWDDAVAKFTEDTLKAYGIVPWHVERMFYRLVKAFESKNTADILRNSADIGHYIADAHVPLHTTENYNGQFTGQEGIHGLLESRLPELFAKDYDLFAGKAYLITKPLDEIWKVVIESSAFIDTVFNKEREASLQVPSDRKYIYENRGIALIKTYSPEFSKVYHQKLDGLVERRMREATLRIGSFWFSAWVKAGQPKLDYLMINVKDEKVPDSLQSKFIGRPEAQ